jgi:anaerobic ribonucleoside-triphosphate reductase
MNKYAFKNYMYGTIRYKAFKKLTQICSRHTVFLKKTESSCPDCGKTMQTIVRRVLSTEGTRRWMVI